MISSDDGHELALIRDQLRQAHDLLREITEETGARADRLVAVDACLESAAIGLEFWGDPTPVRDNVIDITARIRARRLAEDRQELDEELPFE